MDIPTTSPPPIPTTNPPPIPTTNPPPIPTTNPPPIPTTNPPPIPTTNPPPIPTTNPPPIPTSNPPPIPTTNPPPIPGLRYTLKNRSNRLLSSTQEHYLKKQLVVIQLTREFNSLSPTYNDISGLRRFGPPFVSVDPRTASLRNSEGDLWDSQQYDKYDKTFPLLRHLFRNNIQTFPFIVFHLKHLTNPSDFWVKKLQIFFELWKSKKISNSNDRGEISKRKLALFKITSLLVMFFNSAIYCKGDDEYFNSDITRNAYKKINKVIKLDDLDVDTLLKHEDHFFNGFSISVVGVSVVQVQKTRLKSTFMLLASPIMGGGTNEKYFKNSYSFIIRVKEEKTGSVHYVKRAYSDFAQLAKELKMALPSAELPALPSKNNSDSIINLSGGGISDDESDVSDLSDIVDDEIDAPEKTDRNFDNFEKIDFSELANFDKVDDNDTEFHDANSNFKVDSSEDKISASDIKSLENDSLRVPPNPSPSENNKHESNSINDRSSRRFSNSSDSPIKSGNISLNSLKVDTSGLSSAKFPRERLRVSLRGYLYSLCNIESVMNTREFLDFLDDDSFTELSATDRKDVLMRSKLDDLIVIQQFKFQQETIKAITDIQTAVSELKNEIYLGDEGINYIFNRLKISKTTKDLPGSIQSFIKLAQIEIASTIHELFLANDNCADNLKLLKSLHGVFPYKIVSTILRFTNPLHIVKKLIDLFTYQAPLGFSGQKSRSLLQIIFTSILNDDVKHLEKKVTNLRKSINRFPDYIRSNETRGRYYCLIQKIDEYLHSASDDTVLTIKKNCKKYNIELVLAVVLNNNDLERKIDDQIALDVLASYQKWLKFGLLSEDKTDNSGKKSKGHGKGLKHKKEMLKNKYFNELRDDSKLFTMISSYFHSCLRIRDKDSMKELWDEPELVNLIKEIISIFFQPLIVIFTKAELYVYLPILQKYFNELIALVQLYQSDRNLFLSNDFSSSGGGNVVASLMALQTKYQEHFYTFMRNLYLSDLNGKPDERIFVLLISWINKFIDFLTFVRDKRPDLKLDLNDLVDEIIRQEDLVGLAKDDPNRLNKQKLVEEIDDIINNIRVKKEAYNKIINQDLTQNGTRPSESDLLSNVRNKGLNKNWTKINDHITTTITDELAENGDSSKPGKSAAGLFGLNDDDITESNLDSVEVNETKKEDSFVAYANPEVILDQLYDDYELHKTQSDSEFFKTDQFGDYITNVEISKLSDKFNDKIYDVLKEYRDK
ncbi:hypothetical protein B5S28_g35 [[Candida] boidinii]|nr:hypothetical protein B5S28_g35 [[Candida] boidinii]OWB59234.1 hypothetical protein B5S29_g88 [[Candida] boidinii]